MSSRVSGAYLGPAGAGHAGLMANSAVACGGEAVQMDETGHLHAFSGPKRVCDTIWAQIQELQAAYGDASFQKHVHGDAKARVGALGALRCLK